jgi:hypothetical protein
MKVGGPINPVSLFLIICFDDVYGLQRCTMIRSTPGSGDAVNLAGGQSGQYSKSG